ncbi:adenylosuccinate lyase [Gammaproteobacteria bacterium]|mgnify:FL=1|nr:adenylosuccinate lyase [Gammaproteobacteria bacterium]MDC1251248.1 adenylosuccinate lyase [Gammaproteobacteria bacterium]|tara:strand:+ start:294 stop:1667 length:1374 start_codon:yes stop_codon:yes gene_type:complete
MKIEKLLSISPLDGRYSDSVADLRGIASEYGLIRYRVIVEIKWFIHLSKNSKIKELPSLNIKDTLYLNDLIDNFNIKDAKKIKSIESRTNHDVKAVEYFLKEKFKLNKNLAPYTEFIHFACTSEDINNLAYALMIKDASMITKKSLKILTNRIKFISKQYSNNPMLSRTHGQSASPTTMGKEFANFFHRIKKLENEINRHVMSGKINGAVGNYNAHMVAYPQINWEVVAKSFVNNLKLDFNKHTTQVEPKDTIALLLGDYVKLNNILIDLCRDIWGYISLGYFSQQLKEGEVGSSTMPHKVNPIDFENAEGNFGIANAILTHISNTVTISRWQRDLTDSTIMRNIGSSFGYINLALYSLLKGLNKLEINKIKLKQDLDDSWEVLTEAVQTVIRKNNIPNGYELMKKLSRGKKISREDLAKFIDEMDVPYSDKQNLSKLTPSLYIGLAAKLAKDLKDS